MITLWKWNKEVVHIMKFYLRDNPKSIGKEINIWKNKTIIKEINFFDCSPQRMRALNGRKTIITSQQQKHQEKQIIHPLRKYYNNNLT